MPEAEGPLFEQAHSTSDLFTKGTIDWVKYYIASVQKSGYIPN